MLNDEPKQPVNSQFILLHSFFIALVMRGQVNDFADSVNRKTVKGAGKNLHLCRHGAFENPLFSTGASHSGFGSHSMVGLQAPNVCWLPAGTPSVLQKDRRLTNTAEVMEAVADFQFQSITCLMYGQGLSRSQESGVKGQKEDNLCLQRKPYSGYKQTIFRLENTYP